MRDNQLFIYLPDEESVMKQFFEVYLQNLFAIN